jgi:DNA helicase HerA-like ATPase
MTSDLYIGSRTNAPEQKENLIMKYANRHGLIAGATGTGKTVTLQGMAEGFSKAGVPVFLSDVKGDLSGMAAPSEMQDFLVKRADIIGFTEEYKAEAMPVTFWDLFGKQGHPVRTTITDMGALLLARILDLNDTQDGVLNIAFQVAQDEDMPLLDLKDLRALLINMGERSKELSLEYGNVTGASIGAIQRKLLQIEQQGGKKFFGEPALELTDFIRCDENGYGQVNILAADKLMQTPKLYATFLLWMLTELFDILPEAGDQDKPKLVFFFDEAHLLFNNAPRSLLETIEQVVKLIRSKGVGVYFVTQNPADIPEGVLSQLGNRVQHALRAFTPKQQKAIKLASQTYRANPAFKVSEAITQMGVGEALVSTLEKKGQPSIVQRTLVRPPYSKLGPVTKPERVAFITANEMNEKYGTTVDRKSAYEVLKARRAKREEQAEKAATQATKALAKAKAPKKRKSNRQSPAEAFIKSMLRQVGTQIAREGMRAIKSAMKGR